MDRANLCDSLIAWIKTFDFTAIESSLIDFRDGILISQCLNNIDPQYFNDEWLNKMKAEINDNWRLKLLNLKKITEAISDYYSEVLNHSLTGFQMPNLNLYVETNDQEELSRLLQLVLGCAVNCERKSEYIKIIMEMPVDTQHMIMTAIQDLMAKDRAKSNTDDDLNYQLKKTLFELNRVNEQKEEIEQKCKSLDSQLSIIQDEKLALINEIEMLKEKLQREDNSREEIGKQKKLQQKIDLMQEELYKLESMKEEYRIRYEAIKNENELLINKNTEFKKIAQETQLLKDELDIMKHNTDKVARLESQIEQYKIKLEEMSDLKNQIKLLEESNTKYMESIIEMEEENKKISSFKSQIDFNKKQMQELHENLLTQEMKVKKYEYENKRLDERNNALQQDKERLANELDTLKEKNEELKIMNVINTNSNEDNQNTANAANAQNMILNTNIFSEIELLNFPPETKEKILRLLHENKMLKSKQNEFNEEKYVELQNQFDDEKQRNNDLQIKLNLTQSQIIELESQISDLTIKSQSKEQTSYTSTGSKLNDLIDFKNKLTAKNTQLEDEVRKHQLTIQNLESQIEILTKEKTELKEALVLKEKERIEMDEKYRLYLEKAKIVIKSLDPLNNSTTSSEVQLLKNQLIEKDKKIKQLMKDQEKLSSSHEKEEQLLLSAWHKLVLNLNRNTIDERIENIGNSFLSQQRHLPKRQTSSNLVDNSIITNNNNTNDIINHKHYSNLAYDSNK